MERKLRKFVYGTYFASIKAIKRFRCQGIQQFVSASIMKLAVRKIRDGHGVSISWPNPSSTLPDPQKCIAESDLIPFYTNVQVTEICSITLFCATNYKNRTNDSALKLLATPVTILRYLQVYWKFYLLLCSIIDNKSWPKPTHQTLATWPNLNWPRARPTSNSAQDSAKQLVVRLLSVKV